MSFIGARFSGGRISFSGARFSGGTVYFVGGQFSGRMVDFDHAEFSGGRVDFSGADDWSSPPAFPRTDAPPAGVKPQSRRINLRNSG